MEIHEIQIETQIEILKTFPFFVSGLRVRDADQANERSLLGQWVGLNDLRKSDPGSQDRVPDPPLGKKAGLPEANLGPLRLRSRSSQRGSSRDPSLLLQGQRGSHERVNQ